MSVIRRQGSSAAVSNVSQDSNSMALDNSIDTTTTHLPAGNYEQVAYTDSGKVSDEMLNNPQDNVHTSTEPYSQWKLRFSKVLVSAERLEFGRIIGEGEWHRNGWENVGCSRSLFDCVVYPGEFSLVCRATYFSVVTDSPMQVAVKKLKGKDAGNKLLWCAHADIREVVLVR